MSFNRLNYDTCTYKHNLLQSVGVADYVLGMPQVNCGACFPADPALRMGTATGTVQPLRELVDVDSELMGITRKASNCPLQHYLPAATPDGGSGASAAPTPVPLQDCRALPNEGTRLSNPPCTLRGHGWNRWEWLCQDPQRAGVELPFAYNIKSALCARHFDKHMKDMHVPQQEWLDERLLLHRPLPLASSAYPDKSARQRQQQRLSELTGDDDLGKALHTAGAALLTLVGGHKGWDEDFQPAPRVPAAACVACGHFCAIVAYTCFRKNAEGMGLGNSGGYNGEPLLCGVCGPRQVHQGRQLLPIPSGFELRAAVTTQMQLVAQALGEVLHNVVGPNAWARADLAAERPTVNTLAEFCSRQHLQHFAAPLWHAEKKQEPSAASGSASGAGGSGSSSGAGGSGGDDELPIPDVVNLADELARLDAGALGSKKTVANLRRLLQPHVEKKHEKTYLVLNNVVPRSGSGAAELPVLLRLQRRLTVQDVLLGTVNMSSRNKYTVLLVGRKGTFTALHLDRVRAINLAMAPAWLADKSAALATWVFVAPRALAKVLRWAEENASNPLLVLLRKVDGGTRPYFTPAGVAALVAAFGSEDIIVVQQRHGDVVEVPPGYAHQVTNNAACVKLAFDDLRADDLAALYEMLHVVNDVDTDLEAEQGVAGKGRRVSARALLLADTPQMEQAVVCALCDAACEVTSQVRQKARAAKEKASKRKR